MFFSFNRRTLLVFVTYLTGALYRVSQEECDRLREGVP